MDSDYSTATDATLEAGTGGAEDASSDEEMENISERVKDRDDRENGSIPDGKDPFPGGVVYPQMAAPEDPSSRFQHLKFVKHNDDQRAVQELVSSRWAGEEHSGKHRPPTPRFKNTDDSDRETDSDASPFVNNSTFPGPSPFPTSDEWSSDLETELRPGNDALPWNVEMRKTFESLSQTDSIEESHTPTSDEIKSFFRTIDSTSQEADTSLELKTKQNDDALGAINLARQQGDTFCVIDPEDRVSVIPDYANQDDDKIDGLNLPDQEDDEIDGLNLPDQEDDAKDIRDLADAINTFDLPKQDDDAIDTLDFSDQSDDAKDILDLPDQDGEAIDSLDLPYQDDDAINSLNHANPDGNSPGTLDHGNQEDSAIYILHSVDQDVDIINTLDLASQDDDAIGTLDPANHDDDTSDTLNPADQSDDALDTLGSANEIDDQPGECDVMVPSKSNVDCFYFDQNDSTSSHTSTQYYVVGQLECGDVPQSNPKSNVMNYGHETDHMSGISDDVSEQASCEIESVSCPNEKPGQTSSILQNTLQEQISCDREPGKATLSNHQPEEMARDHQLGLVLSNHEIEQPSRDHQPELISNHQPEQMARDHQLGLVLSNHQIKQPSRDHQPELISNHQSEQMTRDQEFENTRSESIEIDDFNVDYVVPTNTQVTHHSASISDPSPDSSMAEESAWNICIEQISTLKDDNNNNVDESLKQIQTNKSTNPSGAIIESDSKCWSISTESTSLSSSEDISLPMIIDDPQVPLKYFSNCEVDQIDTPLTGDVQVGRTLENIDKSLNITQYSEHGMPKHEAHEILANSKLDLIQHVPHNASHLTFQGSSDEPAKEREGSAPCGMSTDMLEVSQVNSQRGLRIDLSRESLKDLSDELPLDLPDRLTVDLSDELPLNLPERSPVDLSERSPVDLSERLPVDLLERLPIDLPERLPVDLLERLPVDLPDELPLNLPERLPVDLPERLPADLPERLPADLPEELPLDMPDRLPVDLPDELPLILPNRSPVDLPERLPVDLPERLPVDLPGRLPVDLPDILLFDLSGGLPVDLPEELQIDLPKGLPVDLPSGMPKGTPNDDSQISLDNISRNSSQKSSSCSPGYMPGKISSDGVLSWSSSSETEYQKITRAGQELPKNSEDGPGTNQRTTSEIPTIIETIKQQKGDQQSEIAGTTNDASYRDWPFEKPSQHIIECPIQETKSEETWNKYHDIHNRMSNVSSKIEIGQTVPSEMRPSITPPHLVLNTTGEGFPEKPCREGTRRANQGMPLVR